MFWPNGHEFQNGKLVIDRVLGQGGFGITYKAIHRGFNYPVVIKTPNAFLHNDPEYAKYVKRFIREAQMLAQLEQNPHPNIVRVKDLFEEDAAHCLVMEFIAGMTMYDYVKEYGPLSEAEALDCIRPIADALGRVHGVGLVHRDATPMNIMLRESQQPVLIDFGISGEIIPTSVSSKTYGNRAFAPYEQLLKGERNPTVDIYTLSGSLYYIITGKQPPDCLARKVEGEVLIPPQELVVVSQEVNEAILKGMDLRPNRRFSSMAEFLAALSPISTIRPSAYSYHNDPNGKHHSTRLRFVIPETFPGSLNLIDLIAQHGNLITEDQYIVGLTPQGELVTSSWSEIPHRIVAGITGTGKTNFLKSVIYQFLYADPQRQLYVVDFQAGMHYQLIADVRPSLNVVTDLEDFAVLLSTLWEEHENRRSLMRENRVTSLNALNEKLPKPKQRILLIIDEAFFILNAERKTKAEIDNYLTALVIQGRVSGIHIIYCSQRPTSDVIPRQISDNMDERVIFRVQAGASVLLLDDEAASHLPRKPKGYAIYQGVEPELKLVATPYVPNEIWEN